MNAIPNDFACIDVLSCATATASPDVPEATRDDPAGGVGENTPKNQTSRRGGLRSPRGGRPVGSKNKPRVPSLIGVRWHVFQMIRADQHRIVRDLIEGEGRPGYAPRPPFRVEVPTTAQEIVRKNRVETVQVPMFGGYGFIEFDRADDAWKAITSCDGVIRLFSGRTGIPTPLPVRFVEDLVDTRMDRRSVAVMRNAPRKAGDALAVVDGSMAGFPAVCEHCDGLTTRASVMIFGRPVPLTLPWASYRAANG